MSHPSARLRRVISLSALAVAVPFAGTASAAIQTFTTAGSHPFTVPAGVTSLTVEAVGGRGGNLGGYGARVTGTVAVSPGDSLSVVVAGNGDVGLGGSGGGGAVPVGSFAAGGGGASRVMRGGEQLVVAAGGGGTGGDSFPGFPGDGGDAGSPGQGGPDAGGTVGGGGGLAGTALVAGAGGRPGPAPAGCSGGAAGAEGAAAIGGPGALSEDPFGFGDGGGGGGGFFGGGGGGSGGYCADVDEGLGGGGGGGGSSLVPVGGGSVVDSTGIPGVTLTWTDPPSRLSFGPPTVSIRVPADGATYAQGQVVRSSYACTMRSAALLGSCTGTVANDSPIDTAKPGSYAFTAIGVSRTGDRAEQTVHYTVADRRAPAVSGLRLGARSMDLGVARAGIGVAFSLSENAQVVVRVQRARVRGRRRARAARAARVLRFAGRAGRNGFRLRARVGRRTLAPGAYRLVLVATDAAGNRSRPATRRFTVVG